MAQKAQKAQNGPNGPERPKRPRIAQNGRIGPDLPRTIKMAQNGPKGYYDHICWKIQKETFFLRTPCTYHIYFTVYNLSFCLIHVFAVFSRRLATVQVAQIYHLDLLESLQRVGTLTYPNLKLLFIF